MVGRIKVDPQKLMVTASQFGTTGSNIKRETDQMISIVNNLRPYWEGDAHMAYDLKFKQLNDDMQRMYRMIQEHVNDLNTMAREYRTAENQNVQTGHGLAGDVIS
jgi:WXG100 family type VII secretion target